MLKNFFLFIFQLFDRIIFTLCFIIGVQLPEFIQQYSQRLSGHLNEAKHHLEQFQFIANSQYQGDLTLLIDNYQNNNDQAIKQTGELVSALVQRVDKFTYEISQLAQDNYVDRVSYFFAQLDGDMAVATAKQFALAIPLTPFALVTGASFALSVLLVKTLLFYLGKYSYTAIKTWHKANTTNVDKTS